MPKIQDPSISAPQQEHASGCLARITWMLLGNIVLLFCFLAILDNHDQFLSTADFVYWAVVAALIGIRYLDITRLGGFTAAGEPATIRDWYRYSAALVVLGLIIWGIAHWLAWRGAAA